MDTDGDFELPVKGTAYPAKVLGRDGKTWREGNVTFQGNGRGRALVELTDGKTYKATIKRGHKGEISFIVKMAEEVVV